MTRLILVLAGLFGVLAALLALAGCAASTPAVSLPLASDRPTLLFLYTDG
jgi:hypothetical protein